MASAEPVPMQDRRLIGLRAPEWSAVLPEAPTVLEAIQFDTLPPDEELARLDAYVARHPHLRVRAYRGSDDSLNDGAFLERLPSVRRLALDLYELDSLAVLDHLGPDMRELWLGEMRRRHSLAPLARFDGLRVLHLHGSAKGLEVIAQFTELQALMLRSVTLPNLELLVPLRGLKSLDIKLGGTKDLALISTFEQLEYLELWMIRGFDRLPELGGLGNLRHLFLQALKHVTVLPDLSGCAALERVHLMQMAGLTDLTPLLTAPALRELALSEMNQLRWEHVAPFAGHPTLEAATVVTGSHRRNAEIAERLGYPKVDFTRSVGGPYE